jgi:hypothetical protein
MNFNSALSHLTWRFKKCKIIKVNNQDRKAFNLIIEYVNKTQASKLQENTKLSKLYTFLLGHFIEKYNTSIENPIPHREVHRILNRPLGKLIHDITWFLNNRIKNQILKNAGCNLSKHPQLISQKEKDSVLKNLKENLTINRNKKFFLNDAYSVEEVETGIKFQLKNLMNDL